MKRKTLLFLLSICVLFVGALPAGSLICVSDSGLKIEISSSDKCGCSGEHEKHEATEVHSDCGSECQPTAQYKNDCDDTKVKNIKSYKQLELEVSPTFNNLEVSDFLIFAIDTIETDKFSLQRLHKPAIPPPHLITIKITQLLI